MTWESIKDFLIDNTLLLGSLAAVVAIFSFLFTPIRRLFAKSETDVPAIVKTLRETAHKEGVLSTQLGDAQQRIENLEDENRQLTEAVQALSSERSKPDAPAGIDEAVALLAKGETAAAEAVFQGVKERRKAEGAEALKEAAAAARHIGALAFLRNTDKALAAYREAVDLDSDNADGWNRLGHLLYRMGDLDDAEKAYRRILALGNTVDDQQLVAIATGNLGNLYRTRGDLGRAEEMHRKSLALNDALGRKEGMAADYGNLGLVYQIRGDLGRAEEMHKRSLAIEEELGHTEGMASDYGNLGNVYRTRGDLDRAEEMYETSLALHKELGRKEGMASDYGNLGLVYRTRGDLDRAEEMYVKGLALEEELGRKEGIAIEYGNLGALYKTRGDLERAEEMYEKGLELFRQVGAAPQIERIEGLLAELRGSKE